MSAKKQNADGRTKRRGAKEEILFSAHRHLTHTASTHHSRRGGGGHTFPRPNPGQAPNRPMDTSWCRTTRRARHPLYTCSHLSARRTPKVINHFGMFAQAQDDGYTDSRYGPREDFGRTSPAGRSENGRRGHRATRSRLREDRIPQPRAATMSHSG